MFVPPLVCDRRRPGPLLSKARSPLGVLDFCLRIPVSAFLENWLLCVGYRVAAMVLQGVVGNNDGLEFRVVLLVGVSPQIPGLPRLGGRVARRPVLALCRFRLRLCTCGPLPAFAMVRSALDPHGHPELLAPDGSPGRCYPKRPFVGARSAGRDSEAVAPETAGFFQARRSAGPKQVRQRQNIRVELPGLRDGGSRCIPVPDPRQTAVGLPIPDSVGIRWAAMELGCRNHRGGSILLRIDDLWLPSHRQHAATCRLVAAPEKVGM